MIVAIHQPQYLPWLPYFDKADRCDVFVYLDTVQFQKNGVQNRNKVKTGAGATWLTVPVHASSQDRIRDVVIANSQWHQKHIRTIEMNYARAENFQWFSHRLRGLLEREWEYLTDLNIAASEELFDALRITCRRVRSSELEVVGKRDQLVLNICEALNATVYLSGQGAKAYQDDEEFQRRGIQVHYQEYRSQPYKQCHPEIGFVSDLSALDLILNNGDNVRQLLLAGRVGCPGVQVR
jgi:hypothetical protein